VLVAPKLAGADGVPLAAGKGPARMADALRLDEVQIERIGDDVLVIGRPVRAPGRGGGAKAARTTR
jgi:diaminohydroxyphosphoribosylaminopyrimidine deaminase/5-amino-6-(5-phosphoribosylamino)uracil reductase